MEYIVKHREILAMEPIKVTEEIAFLRKHTQFYLFCFHKEPLFTKLWTLYVSTLLSVTWKLRLAN